MIKNLTGELLAGVNNVENWQRYAGIYYSNTRSKRNLKPILFRAWCKNPKGHRYHELCLHLDKNLIFWRTVGRCHHERAKARNWLS